MVVDVISIIEGIDMKSVEIALVWVLMTILLFVSCPSLADSALVIVDAREIRNSEIAAGELCVREGDCSTWETYFIYKAKVKKVLHGDVPVKGIVFAKGQHAGFVDKKINGWMVLVQKIEDSRLAKKLGAQYIVKRSSFPEQYYCFDGKPDDVIGEQFVSRLTSSSGDYFCYSLDDLPEAEE